jgi:ABC-type sulfate transport system substrate-binding protein
MTTFNPVLAVLPAHLKLTLTELPDFIANVLDFDSSTRTLTVSFTERGFAFVCMIKGFGSLMLTFRTAYGDSEASEQHVPLCIQLAGPELQGEFQFQVCNHDT